DPAAARGPRAARLAAAARARRRHAARPRRGRRVPARRARPDVVRPRPDGDGMTTAPAARTAALVAATSLALAGCGGIPTDGPVGSGEVGVTEEGASTLSANDPVPDAGPEEIISGFLQAVDAGIYDDCSAARNHLPSGAARQWDPRARVVVYRGVPEITAQDDGSYLVTVEVDVTLDDAGRYVAAAPGSEEVVTFELARGL